MATGGPFDSFGSAWPAGCKDRESCNRHGSCQYVGCRWQGCLVGVPTLDATKESDRREAMELAQQANRIRMKAVILLRKTDDELTKDFLMHALGADQ